MCQCTLRWKNKPIDEVLKHSPKNWTGVEPERSWFQRRGKKVFLSFRFSCKFSKFIFEIRVCVWRRRRTDGRTTDGRTDGRPLVSLTEGWSLSDETWTEKRPEVDVGPARRGDKPTPWIREREGEGGGGRWEGGGIPHRLLEVVLNNKNVLRERERHREREKDKEREKREKERNCVFLGRKCEG